MSYKSIVCALLAGALTLISANSVYADGARYIKPSAIKLASGFVIEPIITGLSMPTTVIFDGDDMLIAESGYLNTAKPRILRVKSDGKVFLVASEGLQAPVTGLLVYKGEIYVSHKDTISIVNPDGTLKDIIAGLPSDGDHQNNQLALGPDGKIYIGQGTVTNAGVVGEDNYVFGWLDKYPALHDIPCQDTALTGVNFKSGNPLTSSITDSATTGAYHDFGSTSTPGEVIKGSAKCSGSILRFNPDGSGLEIYASGLRNPFGLQFDTSGQLWVTNHGFDDRGSQIIYNDPDYLVKIKKDGWYGWPDYANGQLITDKKFRDPLKPAPKQLLQNHPPLAESFTTFPAHAAANGIAISLGAPFGNKGDIYVAEYGTFAPVTTGPNLSLPGFRVVKVDGQTGAVEDFAVNKAPGPSYLNRQGGFDRLSDVEFGPDGALYVADWGSLRLTPSGLQMNPATGVIWRIYPGNASALRPNGPIEVASSTLPQDVRESQVRNTPAAYKELAPEILILLIGIAILIWLGRFIWRRLF